VDTCRLRRAGPGTSAGLRARRLRAISAFELLGLDAECSLPASEVAARKYLVTGQDLLGKPARSPQI